MLEENQIVSIVDRVARANLTAAVVKDVRAEPATDSEGRDALRITIVITAGSAATIGGDAALDTLVQINDQLQKAGEERLPIVEYAGTDEIDKLAHRRSRASSRSGR